MTARDDLAASIYRAEHDIDRLFRPLRAEIGDVVRANAIDTADGPRIDHPARLVIMREVDAMLDRVFPAIRNNPSALETLIVDRVNEVRLKPIADTVGDIRFRLSGEPALREAMGDVDTD